MSCFDLFAGAIDSEDDRMEELLAELLEESSDEEEEDNFAFSFPT